MAGCLLVSSVTCSSFRLFVCQCIRVRCYLVCTTFALCSSVLLSIVFVYQVSIRTSIAVCLSLLLSDHPFVCCLPISVFVSFLCCNLVCISLFLYLSIPLSITLCVFARPLFDCECFFLFFSFLPVHSFVYLCVSVRVSVTIHPLHCLSLFVFVKALL